MADAQSVALGARATAPAVTYRWRICALLFFATTINYIDRQVLGVLAPELQRVIGWNEIQYSNIVNAFQGAYALGLLLAGRFIDRAGTRMGVRSTTHGLNGRSAVGCCALYRHFQTRYAYVLAASAAGTWSRKKC